MKRITIIGLALLALVSISAGAQITEIHYLNTATLVWNPMTEDAGGTPFPPEFIVTYDVYVYNSLMAIDDQNPANLTPMGTTLAGVAQLDLDFSGFPFALYYAGVRANVDNGQGTVYTSAIAWSYDPVATDPTGPFGYLHLEGTLILPLLMGLKDSGT